MMLIPVVVVVMMLALVLVRKQAETGKEPPKCSGQPQMMRISLGRSPSQYAMTRNEQEIYWQLVQALPDDMVLAQV